MSTTLTNFWYIAFEDKTIKFFDDEAMISKDEWLRRAAPHEVEKLHRTLQQYPDLVPAVPPDA